MLKRNVFMDVMLKRFVRANRIPVVHLSLIPPFPKLGRWEFGEVLNAFERTANASVGFWEMPLPKAALFLLLAALTLSAQAGVREVGAIGLTVGDLDRELMFYTNTLPFDLVFWTTQLVVDDISKLSAKLRESGVTFVSKPGSAHSQIVRDPDGHAMQLDEVSAAAAESEE